MFGEGRNKAANDEKVRQKANVGAADDKKTPLRTFAAKLSGKRAASEKDCKLCTGRRDARGGGGGVKRELEVERSTE